MRADIRVYPRGFLGPDIKVQALRTPDRLADVVKRIKYNDDTPTPRNNIQPNPHVEALYTRLLRERGIMLEFNFREQVIKTAIEAFGVVYFDQWVNYQFNNEFAGELHSKFIEDIFRYLKEGKRNLDLYSYKELLRITDEGDKIGKKSKTLSDYLDFYRSNNSEHIAPDSLTGKPLSITNIIREWVSKPNGTEDLLFTLHILFGND